MTHNSDTKYKKSPLHNEEGLEPWLEGRLKETQAFTLLDGEQERIALLNRASVRVQQMRRDRAKLEARQLAMFIVVALIIPSAMALLILINQVVIVYGIFGLSSLASIIGLSLYILKSNRDQLKSNRDHAVGGQR